MTFAVRRSPQTFTAVRNISRILSIARMIPIASIGRPIEIKTVARIKIPAHGIHAAPIEARIIIITIVICCATLRSIPTTCDTKRAAPAWYRAVPSILIVVPIGKVKFTTSSERFAFSFATFIDTHIVALLDEVEKATKIASFTFPKYFPG